MDPNNDVEFELPTYVRIYKSGRIERLKGTEIVPASIDPATGVTSKDVVIDTDTGVSARLYLPNLIASQPKKLPILIYYHGGGFITESSFSPIYHGYINPLAAKAGVLVVSVNYRRAPEHPLPTAYDDSWAALQWVASHVAGGSEAWLVEHGDFGRMFLAGDSAGANIAHHMALRAGAEGLGPRGGGTRIEGVALVHPYFWGRDPVGSETTDPRTRGWVEDVWRFACPGEEGVDDPRINPMVEGAPSLAGLAGRRVMVTVAETDLFRERGRSYYEGLVESGWGGEAELHETAGEGHVFHLFNPTTEKALAVMERMVTFFNRQ